MTNVRRVLWVLVLVVAAGAAYLALVRGPVSDPNRSTGSGSVTGVTLGGDFTLTAHTGAPFDTASLRGRLPLLYFGYSFCPDVCPLELTKMSRALQTLEAEGLDTTAIQPLFVTIDPERDTVEALADYVPDFHERLIGLTGSQEDIDAARKLFRVHAAKTAGSEEEEYYLMDHTSLIFFLDEKGALVRFFTSRDSVETIIESLRGRLGG